MKKILSIILAMTMVLSNLVFNTTAFAEENSVTVSYSVCDGGMLTMEPTDIEVTADISDKYADVIGYNDTLSVPTVLDATIAAHIFMFGDDFMDYAPLSLTSAGWVSGAFGEETSATSYRNNGNSCWSFDEALTDGGYVEFMFYQDTIMYSDAYVSFNARKINAGVGKETIITATKEVYDASYNLVEIPASDIMVTVNGYDIGLTDKNGQISFVFDEEGTYKVSAYVDLEEDAPIFIPYAEVNARKYQLEDYIQKEIKAGVKSFANKDSFYTADNAVYFLNLCKAGAATNMNKIFFADSIKSNLIANDGKILVNGAENLGTYGAVIQALELCGYNAKSFYGYNIYNALEAMDVNSECHPYYYRYAIEVASKDYAIELCKAYIDKYYTMGKGLNYWGYSCDNTGNFLASIAKYKDEFSDYVKDATALLETYSTDKGYFYNYDYTDENANSTASALLGYAAIGDADNAFKCYSILVEDFEGEEGEFLYYGEPNEIATKDAIVALEAYYDFVYNNNYEHPVHLHKSTTTTPATCTKKGLIEQKCVICEHISKESTPALGHKVVKDKAVAPTYAKSGKTEGSHCSRCGKVLVAQNTVAKLTVAKPANVKILAKSKAFTLNWSKNSKATGYQIQYSTKSDFNSKKTLTITKNSTISKTVSALKSNKKYYVRIRAYKTFNGKKYYSNWVNKTVTTKK